MSLIEYHHRNALADVVGSEHGVSTAQLDAMLGKGDRYTKDLKKPGKKSPLLFASLPDDSKLLKEVQLYAERHAEAFDDLILVGMGGSSLSALATYKALYEKSRKENSPRLHLLDTSDPEVVAAALMGLEATRSRAIVISKSGNTLETLCGLSLVSDWFTRNACSLERSLTIISNPAGGFLNDFAKAHRVPRFEIPEGVGGRFSALTPVGLLPAAMLGFDVGAMLEGAASQRDQALSASPIDNKPLLAASIHAELFSRAGKTISVFMPYVSRLRAFGQWYIQLWAESLGKARDVSGRPTRSGQTPIIAVGAEAQHSQLQLFLEGPNDKVITLVEMNHFRNAVKLPDAFDFASASLEYLKGKEYKDIVSAQLRGTQQALSEMSRPSVRLTLESLDARSLGALFMFYELQTAYTGYLLHINPFDQPAVERGKAITREFLGG